LEDRVVITHLSLLVIAYIICIIILININHHILNYFVVLIITLSFGLLFSDD